MSPSSTNIRADFSKAKFSQDLILEATNVNDILNASKANRNFYHLAQRHIRRKYKAEFADVDLSDIDPKTHGSAYQFLVKLLADKRIAHYVTAIYLKDWLETQTAAWYYDLPPIEWSSRERKDKCTYNEYKPDVCVTHHHKKHEDRGIVAAKYSRFDGLLGSIKSFDLSKPDRRVEHGVSGQKLAVHISWLNKIKAALHREDDDAGFALMLHLLPNIEEIYISYPGSLYFTRELLNPFLEGCSSWFPNLGHPILTNLQTVSVIGNCQSRYGGNESPDSVFDSTLDHDGHIKSLIKFPSVRNVEIKSINELNDISSFMSEQIACYSVVDCVAHELDPPIQLIHPGLEEFIWEPR